MITLGIDYGASNIGIALVRNTDEGNEPLFAGTIVLDARGLKDKTETRAGIRRTRRTRKTKRRRLKDLENGLAKIDLDPEQIRQILRFCERRGYKSLYGNEESNDRDSSDDFTYRFTREEFFQSLEQFLARMIPSELQDTALNICEETLNRYGEPRLEIRPIRFENRGISRCAWEGCNKTSPRRINATEDALKQQLVTFFQSALREEPRLLDSVNSTVTHLNRISYELRSTNEKNLPELQKSLLTKARALMKSLRDELTGPKTDDERFVKSWKYVQENIKNILKGSSGRNTYCREHSEEYVRTVLSGKQPPFKKSISESEIISRREQIAFSKIWRYIEARMLPLAPEGIDAIVVERTAFDILGGNRKQIRKTSDQRIEEIYQLGPMFGFNSRREMLQKEFGGLCAYCGNPSDNLIEQEHILPRRDFFFDSYLNILPACPTCNAEKGSRRQALLHINDQAYVNYVNYLSEISRKRPLHFLHNEKKGILNLMRDPNRKWEVDRYLSLIANNFAAIVQSQRGPRPFARFLFSKLSERQTKPPKIKFRSGRHTALYRNIAFPNFQKEADKASNGKVNHAVDAILLASQLPDPNPLESRGLNLHTVGAWRRSVVSRSPRVGKTGIPVLPIYKWYVEGFEHVDSDGYVLVEMATMNWNKKDSATHKQDPYGSCSTSGKPTKRTSAAALYDDLVKEKDQKRLTGIIDSIYHPALRSAMTEGLSDSPAGPSVAKILREWLRKSVRNSIGKSSFSEHPADVSRKRDLESFINNPDAPIPRIIGIKRFDSGVQGKIDLERLDQVTGKTGHRYMAQPANKGVLLVYRAGSNGKTDFSKPFIGRIRQNSSLKTDSKVFGPKPVELERGLIWGDSSYSNGWERVLEEYLRSCGFTEYLVLTAGCVACYQDGKQLFIRNFDKQDFKVSMLKGIVGVRRTPFSDRIIRLKSLTMNG